MLYVGQTLGVGYSMALVPGFQSVSNLVYDINLYFQ